MLRLLVIQKICISKILIKYKCVSTCISNHLELAFHLLIASPNFFVNNVLLCANSTKKKDIPESPNECGISFYKHEISIITSPFMEVSASEFSDLKNINS